MGRLFWVPGSRLLGTIQRLYDPKEVAILAASAVLGTPQDAELQFCQAGSFVFGTIWWPYGLSSPDAGVNIGCEGGSGRCTPSTQGRP